MQERYDSWREIARARTLAARELVPALDKMADYCHGTPALPEMAMALWRILVLRHEPLFITDAFLDVTFASRCNP